MKVGIIGAGAIATYLMENLSVEKQSNIKVTSVYVRDIDKYKHLENTYGVNLYTELTEFLHADVDIIVEAANIEAAQSLLPKVVEKKDVVLISIGVLSDHLFLQRLHTLAEQNNRYIYLPSGAIGGLDLLQNAYISEAISEVSLTTRKPAHTLVREPVESSKVVFEGKASDAIKQFPKNINVSIVLALAGLGMDKTNVTIIADPMIENNIHTIEMNGAFGNATFTVTNNPLPENPKTSYLAAMSIRGTLQRLSDRIKIGC
ncbi:aspartate dehydrogenase [Virgibacillus sp. W0430]|uniref:aspartate dehydrogenase n=1 Tax=Virgibacillus sp. W0430 TaxID=3391580 RepID=UPI003F449110